MKIKHREFIGNNHIFGHASTIEIWKDHPVIAWFAGHMEGHPDTRICIYNLKGAKEIIEVQNRDHLARWNPILVNTGDKLLLFEKAGVFCDRWQTFLHDITEWDRCHPFENKGIPKDFRNKQYVLPAGLNGPVKSRPIIEDGIMYCGSSVETKYDWTSYIESYDVDSLKFIDRSKPLNVTFKKKYKNSMGQICKSLGVIQPTLWFDKGSRILHAFMRSSHGLNRVFHSQVHVHQCGWTDPQPIDFLDNPNSAVDVVLHNERLFMVWNPSKKDRFPLVISELDKDTFKEKDRLIVSEGLDRLNYKELGCNTPEYSYPYMIENNGELLLTYTFGRRCIEYVVVEI